MSIITMGKKVPAKKFNSTRGKLSLKEFQGAHLILYFYPRDNTPGCTNEALDFNQHLDAFMAEECHIIGVSRDSLSSHEKFIAKYELDFDLISDEDETLCQAFDVIKEKNMYGKKVMGIERSTFYIDPDGKLQHEWRKVKVKGHVEAVLAFIKQ